MPDSVVAPPAPAKPRPTPAEAQARFAVRYLIVATICLVAAMAAAFAAGYHLRGGCGEAQSPAKEWHQ